MSEALLAFVHELNNTLLRECLFCALLQKGFPKVLAIRKKDGLFHPRGRGQVLLQLMLLLPKITLLSALKPIYVFREAVSRVLMMSKLHAGQHNH